MPGLATRAQFRRHAIGFDAVFCEEPFPLPGGTLCVLCVMQADETPSAAMLEILRGREAVLRELLRNWPDNA